MFYTGWPGREIPMVRLITDREKCTDVCQKSNIEMKPCG